MSKLRKVIHSVVTDHKIQCFGAIQICAWWGPWIATIAVIVSEMVYIAVNVFTMTIEEVQEKLNDE